MFRVVVLRLCVFDMRFLVNCMVVVEVIESINLIGLSPSARPHLVRLFQLLSLLLCWIRLLGIAFEASVPHNLVDHSEVI